MCGDLAQKCRLHGLSDLEAILVYFFMLDVSARSGVKKVSHNRCSVCYKIFFGNV